MEYVHPDFVENFDPARVDCSWTTHLQQLHQQTPGGFLPQDAVELWGQAASRWKEFSAVLEENAAAQHQAQLQRLKEHQEEKLQCRKNKQQPQPQHQRNNRSGGAALNAQSARSCQQERERKRLTFSSSDDEDDGKEALKVGASIRAALSMMQRHAVRDSGDSAADNNRAAPAGGGRRQRDVKTLKSALDVEAAADLEAWCDERVKLECSMSAAVSGASSTRAARPAAPEALRYMTVAEKNAASRDWVSAVKNYSNGLEAQVKYCCTAPTTSCSSQQHQQSQNHSTAAADDGASGGGGGGSGGFVYSWGNEHLEQELKRQMQNNNRSWTQLEKTVVAVLLSNRAACRLGLFDFEGCLQDANEALSFAPRHPAALARCAHCLIVQPWNSSSHSNSNSNDESSKDGCSSSSSAVLASSSRKTACESMLDRCDAANESSIASSTTSSSSTTSKQQQQPRKEQVFPFVSKFDTSPLRAAATKMNEFEQHRNGTFGKASSSDPRRGSSADTGGGGGIVGALGCISAAANACNDPRFDLLRIEILAASGAYDEAAAEAAVLNSVAPGLPDAWALRGSYVFKATPDGSGAATAMGFYRKAADVYRNLHRELARSCFSLSGPAPSSSSSSFPSEQSAAAVPSSSSSTTTTTDAVRGSAAHAARRSSTPLFPAAARGVPPASPLGNKSGGGGSNTLYVGASRNTLVADSLQKFEKLHEKFMTSFFDSGDKKSFSSASQVCTEILAMDLVGHRVLRALVLIRRAMCLVEINGAARAVEDTSTAIELLAMDAPNMNEYNNSTSISSSTNRRKIASAFLPFTVAAFATRALAHQKSHVPPRAADDIRVALSLVGEVESAARDSTGSTDDGGGDGCTSTTTTMMKMLYRSVLSRNKEIERLCQRSVLREREEIITAFGSTGGSAVPAAGAGSNSDYFAQQRHFQRTRREFEKQFEQKNGDHDQQTSDADDDESSSDAKYKSYFHSKSKTSSSSSTATAPETTHYDVLGIARDAEQREIIKAYRAAALRWHPDKWIGRGDDDMQREAAERFKLVNAAHAVLKDDLARVRYDATIKQ